MAPQTRTFAEGAELPQLGWLMALFGLDLGGAPLNVTFFLALVAAVLVWLLIWRTRFGYEIRTMGHQPDRGDLCRHPATSRRSSSPC